MEIARIHGPRDLISEVWSQRKLPFPSLQNWYRFAVQKILRASREHEITALVLAAGNSSRMGDRNKLLLTFNDQAMVSHVVDQLELSKVDQIIVVTGNEAEKVAASISQKVKFIHNPDYNEGLSASVKAGLSSLSNDTDAVMICLGDMPYITSNIYNKLIAAFERGKIIAPTSNGKTGNPLMFSSDYFDEFEKLSGDKGARVLLKQYPEKIIEIDVGSDSIFQDIDTPEAYDEIGLLD